MGKNLSGLSNKKRSYAAAGVLAAVVIAFAVIFCRNLSCEYALAGEVISVSKDCYIGVSGYAATETDNGGYFEPTNDDPQLYLNVQGLGTIGGLALNLKSADGGELAVQVFYAKDGADFSERRSFSTALSAQEERVLIPIPQGEYVTLRLDIDGAFTLYGIDVCTEEMSVTRYVSDATVQKCLWYFPAVLIGFPLIFWAHRQQRRRGKALVSVFFGEAPSAGREAHWDYLRILAAVLVILAHACSPMVTQLEETGGEDWKRLVMVCGLSLGLTCNLLYVMLSGALLLGRAHREESVGAFYLRRASRVVIPLAAYYLLLLSLNNEVSLLPPKNIGAALKRIVTGAPDAAPHLWLIYTIVALYLVTPFFRVMAEHLSDKMLLSLAVVIFVLNALTNYLPLFGMSFGASTFLAGWEGVFLLGFILSKKGEKGNMPKWFLPAGLAAFAVADAVVLADSSGMNYVYNDTLPMLLMSCAVFSLFLKYREKFKASRLVSLCSKYSYSIILIHWYVLFVIVEGKLHINALRFGVFGGIAATVILTFLICLALAFVFDNTVVIVCSALFDRLVEKIADKTKKTI